MAFRILLKEEGSGTLEAAIVFPVIVLVFLGVSFLMTGTSGIFNVCNGLGQSLRESGYSWYKDKSLYEDVLEDFSDSQVAKEKTEKAKALFSSLVKPGFTGGEEADFVFSNKILNRSIIGRVSGIEGSYPVYRGAVFIRNSKYIGELLDRAFGQIKENLRDEEEVYVVDGSCDEYEYDRVYHLFRDCSYLKKGYESKSTLKEGRSRGFRVCRICLARKRGMD